MCLAEPKVLTTRLELMNFDLNRVGNCAGRRAGGRELGDEFKGVPSRTCCASANLT